jgi:hypothetical protein
VKQKIALLVVAVFSSTMLLGLAGEIYLRRTRATSWLSKTISAVLVLSSRIRDYSFNRRLKGSG